MIFVTMEGGGGKGREGKERTVLATQKATVLVRLFGRPFYIPRLSPLSVPQS